MRGLIAPLCIGSCLWAGSAAASMPTIDATQLTLHARTSSSTVQLVPIEGQRKDANKDVHCAVTTGKRASVTDPTVQPQSGAGSRLIQSYAPDMPAAPVAGAQGATLNSQTLFKSTGDVAAGVDAGHATTAAALSGFQSASRQVGTTTTVMAALDMNSAARLRNGLAWNSVINAANIWVQALNALNLATTSDASRTALAMRTTITAAPSTLVDICPTGLLGTGTAADPCRSAICTGLAATCLSSSVTDGGNVIFVVAPAAVLATELAAALQTLQSSTR
ncbi:hypothetical protein [Lichenifustis flavocetrariae]|uniref:Antifreeze protein n=1 Tax=Lichenifustis flavocetrariae TaxID=2949735 RepID=A0AA41Z906_9HYPH|nr:hypothetical protein [Lichenifustis flavocetrariae]MCW6512535.1 hypothetical protein [Lichenifustis flavocetrariae]